MSESDNVEMICNVTGCSREKATALLEISNNNVDAAIGLFYETNDQPSIDIDPEPKRPQQEQKRPQQEQKQESSHFEGPTSVEDLMKKAVEQGAKSIDEVGAQQKEVFVGTGNYLGEKGKASQKVVIESKQDKRRVIVFYKDCFTLDDGPPRKFEDPQNREFLESIRNGQYPREIAPKYGEELDVELIDKKGEDWKPAPKDIKAFDGPVQSMSTKTQNASYATGKALTLDTSKPTGSIKVKFWDGSNMVVKVNHDHTVNDLRSHLESLKPCKKPFLLSIQSTGQPISDLSAGLKDAGVIGAAIVQSV